MSTPDVTPTQYATAAGALAAVLAIVYQAPARLQIPILALVGVLGVAWLLADAVIRHGRSNAVAAQHALATAQIQNMPTEGDDSKVVATPAA